MDQSSDEETFPFFQPDVQFVENMDQSSDEDSSDSDEFTDEYSIERSDEGFSDASMDWVPSLSDYPVAYYGHSESDTE